MIRRIGVRAAYALTLVALIAALIIVNVNDPYHGL